MWNEPSKPLFPDARKLSDVFASIEPYPTLPPGETCGAHARGDRKLTVSRYANAGRCEVEGVHGLHVEARPEVLDAIDQSMIAIDHDTIHFEILITGNRRGPCLARVFAKYGQIIGSRLLAEWKTTHRKLAAQLPKEG